MNTELPKYLSGLIVGILLALLFKGCGNTSTGVGPKTIITHTRDTLYLPSHTVYQTKLVPKLVYVDRYHTRIDTVLKSLPKDSLVALLAHREYQDTVSLTKGLKVVYKAKTRGLLDSLALGIVDDRKVMVIHDSTRVTTTLPPKSHSLGIGATVTSLGIAPGIQYTQGRTSVGIHYLLPAQPGLGGIQTSIHFSLGSW